MVSWAAREIGRTRSEARTAGRMKPPGWLPTEKRTSLPRASKLPGHRGRRTLPRARRSRGQAVLHDLPALHHEADPLEHRDVLERIARHRDDVRELPRLERSEEHTSELQSRRDLVCRLLLEKKKK